MADQPQILILGRDKLLLELRKRIFEKRGFSVTTSSDPAATLGDIALAKFALVLLGDSIPEHPRNAFARMVKDSRPEIPIVMLYAQPEERDGLADAFLSNLESPEVLLQTVTALLHRKPVALPGQKRALPA